MTTYNIPTALLGLQGADVRRKGEQQGSIRQKGKSWYISFREWQADEIGNLAYRPVERKVEGDFPNTDRGRRAAEKAGYEQWVSKANAENAVPQGLATLEQFYELRFVPDHVDLLKKGGREHYRCIWKNHIQPTFGAVQMREIGPQMVQRLVSAKIAAGCSPQVIYHVRNCLSAMFRHARNLRFLEGPLPTEGVAMPEMLRKERHALTWDQILVLAEECGKIRTDTRHLTIVMAQTGLRIGEAAGLLWKYVNLTDEWRIVDGEAIPPNSLLVCSSWTRHQRTSPKNRSWRKIPLTAEAWVAFTLHWEMARFRGEDQPVFATGAGTPMDVSNVSHRVLKPAARKIGLPWVSWHHLRHTTATLADKAGLSVAEKQKILGHRTADMSTHYTHPELESVRSSLEKMSAKKPN